MYLNQDTLNAFLVHLDTAFARPGRLYLIGETTQVYEGWRSWTSQIELTAEVAKEDRARWDQAVREAQTEFDVSVIDESPGDLIPLPDGFEQRAQSATRPLKHVTLLHFDPYSVSYRFIARGDEPDYHLVLLYLEKGWITKEEMNDRLAGLLPRFSMDTIQQDPAEFRRKYKGLTQMWHSIRPRIIHRHTTA